MKGNNFRWQFKFNGLSLPWLTPCDPIPKEPLSFRTRFLQVQGFAVSRKLSPSFPSQVTTSGERFWIRDSVPKRIQLTHPFVIRFCLYALPAQDVPDQHRKWCMGQPTSFWGFGEVIWIPQYFLARVEAETHPVLALYPSRSLHTYSCY